MAKKKNSPLAMAGLYEFFGSRVWALAPDALESISALIASALAGNMPFGMSVNESEDIMSRRYEMRGSVAVIPVAGPLAQRDSFWLRYWMLGTSFAEIQWNLRAALEDPAVSSILLDINSLGGEVGTIADLAAEIRAANEIKPVAAYANGTACSAAYWLGSQAGSFTAASTAVVGSIGVITTHWDWSAFLEQSGVKVTDITAGAFKAAGSQFKPLDEESKSYIQSLIDNFYSLFVADVIAGRGLSEKAVRETEAKVYIGKDAVKAGLVDATGSFEEALRLAEEKSKMDMATLKAQHPELFQAVLDEGRAEGKAEAEKKVPSPQAIEEAVATERARCVRIANTAQATTAATAMSEGKDPGVFAEEVLAAHRASAEGQLVDLTSGLAASAGGSGQGKGEGAGSAAEFGAQVDAIVKEKGCARSAAMVEASKKNPAGYEAWLNSSK